MRSKKTFAVAAVALSGALLAAGCSSSPSSSGGSGGGKSVDWATCGSVAKCGGMSALVAAAKKEGQLNVITLPSNWANYGAIMKDFTAKYGIKITDANPEGSSQDEINAMVSAQGPKPRARRARHGHARSPSQARPDGPAGALHRSRPGATSRRRQGGQRRPGTRDYGGYVAIGYNSAKVKIAADVVQGPAQARSTRT